MYIKLLYCNYVVALVAYDAFPHNLRIQGGMKQIIKLTVSPWML